MKLRSRRYARRRATRLPTRGDRIRVLWRLTSGSTAWFAASVKSITDSGKVRLRYDDGQRCIQRLHRETWAPLPASEDDCKTAAILLLFLSMAGTADVRGPRRPCPL